MDYNHKITEDITPKEMNNEVKISNTPDRNFHSEFMHKTLSGDSISNPNRV